MAEGKDNDCTEGQYPKRLSTMIWGAVMPFDFKGVWAVVLVLLDANL